MGIKFDSATKTFVVGYSKRHPKTNQPVSLRRTGVISERKAKLIYDELVAKVTEKIHREIMPKWDALLEEYYSALPNRGITTSTIYKGRKCLECYTSHWLKTKSIDEIKTDEIRQILEISMKEKKEAYRKYFYRCLRQVFLYAIEKDYIVKSPMPVLKFKIADKIKAVLTEAQAIRLLSEAKRVDWDWYPHYAVALYTGMRSGELYALTWDKVDFDRNNILVDESWSSKNGIKSTKSGDDRLVDIAPALLPILKELKLQSEDQQWVLPRNDRWDRGQQAKDLRMFLQVIGLPQIRFHDLRATWATILLGKGMQPVKVMAMGGWKDMDTMMIYMRKSGLDIKGSMSCFDLSKPEPEGKLLSLPSMS